MKFYLKLKVHCTSVSLITGADTTIFLTLKGCMRGSTCMSTSFGPRPHGRERCGLGTKTYVYRERWPPAMGEPLVLTTEVMCSHTHRATVRTPMKVRYLKTLLVSYSDI